ncbi:MAG: DUF945 family protein, partial [Verrucomicrobiae bacterium]|nr:DUF945 family protein [Verrucomicrobiae bacterium]
MAKKIVVVVGIVIVGIIAAAWAGATWLYGEGTQSAFAKIGDSTEDVEHLVTVTPGDYARGFLSSEAVTKISPKGEEETEGKSLSLKHQIFHGPLAITPEGVKPCHSYIVTTLDADALPEEVAEGITKAFGDAEPVTIRLVAEFDGSVSGVIEVPAVSWSEGGNSGRFGGITLTFQGATKKGSSDETELTFLNAELKLAELTLQELDGDSLVISPSTGHMEYEQDKQL